MGQEFYDLGVHVALAPVTGGPLGRAPRNGRNWEGKFLSETILCQSVALSELFLVATPTGWYADPYATGEASYWSVKGLQDAGVQATSK